MIRRKEENGSLIKLYQRWTGFLYFRCLRKLGGSLCSRSMGALNVRTNVIWKNSMLDINARVNTTFLSKKKGSSEINSLIYRTESSPIITPCSWTNTAKSLKISFTSLICSWISLIPCSLSSIMASLNVISLSSSTTSCLNKIYRIDRMNHKHLFQYQCYKASKNEVYKYRHRMNLAVL